MTSPSIKVDRAGTPAAGLAELVQVSGLILPTGWDGADKPGWLYCDGRAVSRTTYAALFTAIGTAFGAGDGSTTFNLPVVPDDGGRGPVLLAEIDSSSGTEFHALTGVMDSSLYVGYELSIHAFNPTTNGDGLGLQFSSDNGSSWITSGYTTRVHFYRGALHGASDRNSTGVGSIFDAVSSSQPPAHGTVRLLNVHAAEEAGWVAEGNRRDGSGNFYGTNESGIEAGTTARNAVRLLTHTTGTHTGGRTIARLHAVLYGLRALGVGTTRHYIRT